MYYPSCVHVLITCLNYSRTEKERHAIWVSMKREFLGSIQVRLTCRYRQINQLKNLFQMNIILCLYPMYSSVSCRPNALLRRAWSCVDFVLPKLFPHINNVFELQQNGKRKVTQYGCLLKGNFRGSI